MSVRRLADDQVQPAAFAFNREYSAKAKVWVKKYPKGREQSAIIPLLMLAQEQDGWVTKPAIETIADMLGMPYIRALEVATFYTQFQLKPVGTRAHVQVCGTTPCMLRGSEELMEVCRRKIHPEPFHTNASGTLSWEEVECQGACVNAPMVMIFKDSYEDLTPERLAYIIDRFEAGRPEEIRPGPQIDRIYSAPVGGPVTLKEKPAVKKAAKAPARTAKAEGPEADKPARPETKPAAQPVKKAAKPASKTAKAADAMASNGAPVKAETLEKGTEDRPKKAGAAPARPAKTQAATPKNGSGSRAAAGNTPASSAALMEAPSGDKPPLDDKNRPAGIEKPAKPDDLKMISGIGPKIEGILHSLGIYTFAQVAAWKKAEREWVDGFLRFKGRIEREDWVRQAKALAKGGEAEYIKVFGKKPR